MEIQWYEGSQAQEKPRRIILDGKRFDVDEVLDRALVFDKATQGYHWVLRVRCAERIFLLTSHWDEWSCKEE
jgi:hypothetical protein